jgi:hypothetical protein
MKVTDHFTERLLERFNYEVETLLIDVLNNEEEKLELTKNSKEIEWFPQFKYKFKKYPNSVLTLYENLNICMVSYKQDLITCYTIN